MIMKILSGAKSICTIGLFYIGFTACNSMQQEGSKGPIILGDPATIVTETDSQYLGDMVMDLEEKDLTVQQPEPPKDTFRNVEMANQLAAQQKQDSINAAQQQKAAAVKAEPKKLSRAEQRALKKKEEEEKRKKEAAARKKKQASTRKVSNKKIAQKETTKRRR